jgi:hypothetical protein
MYGLTLRDHRRRAVEESVRCLVSFGYAASTRVIHRHRIGRTVFARVSALTYRDGKPLAVLTWIQFGDMLAPCVCIELDPAKLRPGSQRRVYRYDGITIDPRFAQAPQPVAA